MIYDVPKPQDAADLQALAAKLEASGAYRVLRRLAPRPAILPPVGVKVRQGLFVDVETTGLDPARDEIIELAMVPFTYGSGGEVYAVGEPFQQLREPRKSIPPEITAITGIDDAMVAGRRIKVTRLRRRPHWSWRRTRRSTGNSSSGSVRPSTPSPGPAR